MCPHPGAPVSSEKGKVQVDNIHYGVQVRIYDLTLEISSFFSLSGSRKRGTKSAGIPRNLLTGRLLRAVNFSQDSFQAPCNSNLVSTSLELNYNDILTFDTITINV